jgi:hypothetical protein
MIKAGWADVFVFGQDFQRLPRYRAGRSEARDSDAGVWGRCDGDFHRTGADELRERRLSAVAFMRRYYRRISNRQFAAAWGMLGARLRRKFASYGSGRLATDAPWGRRCCPPAHGCRAAGRSSRCRCGRVTGMRVAGG